jgi:hypothetical protein
VAPVSVRLALALGGGQDVGTGQVPAQLVRDELSGPLPVGVLLSGGADGAQELCWTSGTNRAYYRHLFAPYRQDQQATGYGSGAG